ncbi:MAG: hypothetical protein RSD28_04485 [Lachnospiraceae bacterium]
MENADQLLNLVEEAVSPFHTIEAVKRQLFKAGYEEITLKEEWELKRGHRYCLTHHGSCLFAFTIGKEFQKLDGFRIGAAHGDFPGFRIKPNPEVAIEYRNIWRSQFSKLDGPPFVGGRKSHSKK